MTKIQQPNRVVANSGSLPGGIRDALEKWLRGEVDDMVPARVVSYDRTTNRATIKPLVMIGTTDGTKISRASIPNIKVFRFGGGGYFMSFPLQAGDFGWLKANDRDISLIMQSKGGEDWPNTKRLHSFSDAMFFPDTIKNWIISGGNMEGAVFQSLDGTRSIAINATSIDIVAPSVNITTPEATMTVTNLTVNGNVAIVGSSLTHNGVNVGDTHTHIGSPTAPDGPQSDTGVPVS
jgi:hypothetical protein